MLPRLERRSRERAGALEASSIAGDITQQHRRRNRVKQT